MVTITGVETRDVRFPVRVLIWGGLSIENIRGLTGVDIPRQDGFGCYECGG